MTRTVRTWPGILLILACSLSACRRPASGALEARLADGSRLQIQGSEQDGARWVLRRGGRTQVLPEPPVALFPVGLFPSPDGRRLAVLSVGEGHPVLEVLDLTRLLEGRHGGAPLHRIDPYPGSIDVVGWEGDRLKVRSDMPLADCCDPSGRMPGRAMSDPSRTFLMDPETGVFRPE